MNLNLTWSRRWRLHETASPRRRRRGRQRVYASFRDSVVPTQEDFDIRIRGGKAPPPLRFWNEMAVPEGIHKAIQDAKYKDPSPIQRQAIPVGLELRDLIGVAETGSGKTAAFAVPLLAYVAQLRFEIFDSSYVFRTRLSLFVHRSPL